MAFTKREMVANSLTRSIEYVLEEGWSWRGGGFFKSVRLQNGGVPVLLQFFHAGTAITVRILTQSEYGIEDEEKAFTDERFQEMILWIKAKALAVYDNVKSCIVPCETGQQLYERA